MATIDVTFMHPTDGTTVDVTVDDSMTALAAINELINAGFIQRTTDGYDLSVKGGTSISGNQTLHNGGAVDKCTIRVVPATDAGATIDVTFMHPTDGTTVDVTVDDSMTALAAINELINAGFIQRTTDGYDLSVKGGTSISGNQTLRNGGAVDKCTIRVVPATDAGAMIDVTFIHPTDGTTLDVTVDDDMTVLAAVNKLIEVGYIQRIPNGYDLSIKGGTEISGNQILRNGGAIDQCTIRIVPETKAGATIDVTFMHPTDGTTVDVTVDDSMTALAAINELINAGFIQRTTDGYDLSVKGGTSISGNQTLHNGGAVDKCTIRVVPATDAGAFADVRRARLKSDYEQISNMVGPVLSFRALSGTAPYIDSYEITIHINSIISSTPTYRNKHVIRVDLVPQYPTVKPSTVMITKPQPFHCNWWESGAYCCGTWSPSEKFGDYLVRLMRTLQFDKEITNPNSPANSTAKEWYLSKINSGLFPCDRTQLPDPSRSTFVVKKPIQSSTTFIIKK